MLLLVSLLACGYELPEPAEGTSTWTSTTTLVVEDQDDAVVLDGIDADVVCTSLAIADGSSDDRPTIVQLHTASGSVEPIMTAATDFSVFEVSSLAVLDASVVVCTPWLTRVSLIDGAVTESHVACEGAADFEGQLLLLLDQGIVQYPSFEAAVAGVDRLMLPLDPWATRIGRSEDRGEVLASWHATSEIERWTTDGDLHWVALEGYDTWVHGVSEAGGALFVLDDGRDTEGPTWWEAIHVFEPTGQEITTIELGEELNLQGLSCTTDPSILELPDDTGGGGATAP